jgi:hypothetical protein
MLDRLQRRAKLANHRHKWGDNRGRIENGELGRSIALKVLLITPGAVSGNT